MVEIPRATSTGKLTTQTTAPPITNVTAFTKTSEALKQFGAQLTKTGQVFKEREKDRESTLAKVDYQKFRAEVSEFYADPNNLNSDSREEAIGKLNTKRKELMGTISREKDRDEFILSTGSSMFQTGATIANAARTQIQKNQKTAFITFKEGKIDEFLEQPITNDLKAASVITELEVERGKLDINGYLSDAERTSATGNFSVEGIKNEIITKKIDHDMDTNLEDARDNLVNRRYGLDEDPRKDKLKEVDDLIEGNLTEATIQLKELHNEGSITLHRDLIKGETNLTDITKRWQDGKISDIERDLYRDIWIGKNVGAVPAFEKSAKVRSSLVSQFTDLGFTVAKPEDEGKPLTKQDLETAGKRATLEKIEKYRINILKARVGKHLLDTAAQAKLDQIDLVRAIKIDNRSEAIYNAERSAFNAMEKWVDKNIGDITQDELKAEARDIIQQRMEAELSVELFQTSSESGTADRVFGGFLRKKASPEVVQAVWLRQRERYIRETNSQLMNVEKLPNTYFDGQKEKNIGFDTSDAKVTRRVSDKEIKKSNSATEKMIRAIQKEGVSTGLDELRGNRQQAEQLGIDVDAVLNRFKQE